MSLLFGKKLIRMKLFTFKASLVLAFLCCSTALFGQSLYDLNTIQDIQITLTQPNWDYQMDTAKYGAEGYIMGSVTINGTLYDSVGVKYKGNSSYDSTQLKNPLHIAFDKFKEQKHQNYADIKLSNGYGDPSMIREVLAYELLANYMHCPKANFAKVYINGNYIGLYSSAESIDKKFLSDHFYSSNNTFVKCNPIVNPGPTTKSNFKYINADTLSYETYYEMKSDEGWPELVTLCDSVTNHASGLESIMDMDRVIWMLAFNNAMINLDSYSGVFAQNHYTYKDATGHFNPVMWDLNMCFGGFPFAGAGGTSMGNLTVTGMQQFAHDNHATDTFWPLINAVQGNPTWRRKYIAHLRTIMQEMVAGNYYKNLATQLQTMIDADVLADNNKFFSYSKFQHGLDSNYVVGSFTVPGISNLLDTRLAYLNGTSDFMASQPVITTINTVPSNVNYNTSFTLLVNVSASSALTVTVGYRFDKTKKFEKVQLYDDGNHNDGSANDQVFGASVTMSGPLMQYYIYAETADAGVFAPQRAEHEFYSMSAASTLATAGAVVINEVLADNIGLQKDEYNDTEDWIELYNTSNQVVDLGNCYLSDNASHLAKWKIPPATYIAPNGYLTIWADDDSWQQILHTNFALSKDSGHVYLSLPDSTISDQVSFGLQTTNVSYGRYPNGSGPFMTMNTTYGYQNDNSPLTVSSLSANPIWSCFPNPAHNEFFIRSLTPLTIEVYNLYGQKITTQKVTSQQAISTQHWPSGLYLIRGANTTYKLQVQHD